MIVGLFSNQMDAGRAIEELSKQDLDEGLRIISRDQIIRDPSDLDPDQLLAEEAGTLGASGVGEAAITTPTLIPGVPARIPAKVFNEMGEKGLQDTLSNMGVEAEEAKFCAESIMHGGILIIVEVEETQESYVREILRQAQAVNLEG